MILPRGKQKETPRVTVAEGWTMNQGCWRECVSLHPLPNRHLGSLSFCIGLFLIYLGLITSESFGEIRWTLNHSRNSRGLLHEIISWCLMNTMKTRWSHVCAQRARGVKGQPECPWIQGWQEQLRVKEESQSSLPRTPQKASHPLKPQYCLDGEEHQDGNKGPD